MDIFGILFSILSFFFVVVPTIGFIFLIRYIIKKSKSDQPKHILEKEKNELIRKARSKTRRLLEWQKDYIESLSNDLDFTYSKGFTRRFNGYVNSLSGDKLMAFRRLDRGNFNTTSKIIAITNDLEIYFSQNQSEVSVYVNSKYFGKFINDKIIDHNQRVIGSLNRNNNGQVYYIVELNNEKLAYIIKNTDRRTFLRNPFFDFHPSNAIEAAGFDDNPVSISKMLKLYRELAEYEYQWILAIVAYEIIYYGIDFTQ